MSNWKPFSDEALYSASRVYEGSNTLGVEKMIEQCMKANKLVEALKEYRNIFKGGNSDGEFPSSIRFSGADKARDLVEKAFKEYLGESNE